MAFLTALGEQLTGCHWIGRSFPNSTVVISIADFPGEYACSTDQPFADFSPYIKS